jgi:hypothetical protein
MTVTRPRDVTVFGAVSEGWAIRDVLTGGVMLNVRLAAGTVVAAVALVLIPVAPASAHVHGVTPLRCTPAPANAGANQTNETPASAAEGGPIAGVIPVTMGGNVPLNGGGFDAAVCTP